MSVSKNEAIEYIMFLFTVPSNIKDFNKIPNQYRPFIDSLFVEKLLKASDLSTIFSYSVIKYDYYIGDYYFKSLNGHIDRITDIKEISGKLITSSHDNTLKVWSLKTNSLLFTLEGHTCWVTQIVSLDE